MPDVQPSIWRCSVTGTNRLVILVIEHVPVVHTTATGPFNARNAMSRCLHTWLVGLVPRRHQDFVADTCCSRSSSYNLTCDRRSGLLHCRSSLLHCRSSLLHCCLLSNSWCGDLLDHPVDTS